MLNPMKAVAAQFLRRAPATLLVAGIAVSLFDFGMLYTAAAHDGVLFVDGGIGLFQNYGLSSTVIGDAVLIYLARKYYDAVCSFRVSKAVTDERPVAASLSVLTDMITMKREYRFLIYLLVAIGAAFWISNTGFHVVGNPEIRWGHKVFDSPDHTLTFLASRLHNLYTWLIVFPLVGHVMLYTSIQLRRGMELATRQNALRYDLLNPDQRGGFVFVENAYIVFNVVAAVIYIQITMHIETFERMNAEHVIAYIALTLLLIGVNRAFLGDMHGTLKTLRLESLNRVKDKVYKDDKLSFEILKYCYERRVNRFWILNLIVKAGAIMVSGAMKLWPLISARFTGA